MMKKLSITFLVVCLYSGAADNFSIKVVDKANNPQIKNLYVVIKGINPKTNKQCFVKFKADGSGSVGVCEDVVQSTDSQTYSYPFNKFKDNTMLLPNIYSGRIYLSLNNKLVMPIVGKAPKLGIADPSPYNKSDPNYQFLYDKIELTYTGHNTVTNPTAVDYIALPVAIHQNNVTYGMTKARKEIFSAIETAFNKAPNKAWKQLIVGNGKGTILRILSPGRDDNYFDANYLNSKDGGYVGYITDVWNYYKTKKITIDCSELKGSTNPITPKLPDYQFTGSVDASGKFVFTNKAKDYTVKIGRPTSDQFFLASQGPFEAKNDTPKAVIVRDLTAAWSVGLLPAADGTVLSKKYFTDNKSNFYKLNTYLATKGQKTGPWYNLYAKAIHSQSEHDYAWPYDDILGLDGTNSSTDKNPATLTLADMSKTKIPQ